MALRGKVPESLLNPKSDATVGVIERCTMTSRSDPSIRSLKCSGGLARDCVRVIDRLISTRSFDFCEYAGPVSVEGLAGSAEGFRLCFVAPSSVSSMESESATNEEKDNDRTVLQKEIVMGLS